MTAWFAETLRREAKRFGGELTIVTVIGSGTAAFGDGAVAVGEGGVGVGGDVHGDVMVDEHHIETQLDVRKHSGRIEKMTGTVHRALTSRTGQSEVTQRTLLARTGPLREVKDVDQSVAVSTKP
jgi:hypothetical protein